MRLMRVIGGGVAVCGVLLLGAPALAEPCGGHTERRIERLQERLGLSAEQTADVRRIFQQARDKQTKRGAISEEVAKILTEPQREQFKVLRAEHKARRAEHRIERLQERLGLSAEQTADVRRIFQQARDKQTKRGAISEEVAKILTEPQREQFKALQAERKARKAAGHPSLSHH